jgi:hypothetical protein
VTENSASAQAGVFPTGLVLVGVIVVVLLVMLIMRLWSR